MNRRNLQENTTITLVSRGTQQKKSTHHPHSSLSRCITKQSTPRHNEKASAHENHLLSTPLLASSRQTKPPPRARPGTREKPRRRTLETHHLLKTVYTHLSNTCTSARAFELSKKSPARAPPIEHLAKCARTACAAPRRKKARIGDNLRRPLTDRRKEKKLAGARIIDTEEYCAMRGQREKKRRITPMGPPLTCARAS